MSSLCSSMGRPTVNAADSEFQVIEFHMLQKTKYFPMAMLSGLALRCSLYPLTLVKTRIQLQRRNDLYTGTIDAFRKIIKNEGVRGLYRGFGINCFMVLPSLSYIGSYEWARGSLKKVSTLSGRYRALIAGCCASLMSQTFIVPIDVISQYLMVLGPHRGGSSSSSRARSLALFNPLCLPAEAMASRAKATFYVISSIYKQYGFAGFYRGFVVSLCTYAPSSALWWFFYDSYCSFFSSALVSFDLPRLAIQCLSAPTSSMTVCFLSNPLDTLRSRIQLQRQDMLSTMKQLWKEEKLRIFTKSLTARLTQSTSHSFFIVLSYETVKRMALHEEYKHNFSW